MSNPEDLFPHEALDALSVPDRVGYITALRGWDVYKPNYLVSQNWVWPLREPLEAVCNLHLAPERFCFCGIHGISHITDDNRYNLGDALGEVALWGDVVIHEYGYRAQYAYPLSLYIPRRPELTLKTCTAYGIKALTQDEAKQLIQSYSPPPVCPICNGTHLLGECTSPDKEKIYEEVRKWLLRLQERRRK